MDAINKQKGVALITAIFIFSLVAIAAVAMADRQSLDIRRTENLIHYDHAYMYALNAEKYAQAAISRDTDRQNDYYGENNGQNFLTLPVSGEVEGGTISGFIRDISARFPVNNLVDANGNSQQHYVDAFDRFVSSLLGGNNCANQGSFNPDLAHIVLDWIDGDEQSVVGGAEDLVYLNIENHPHRTANQKFSSISELRQMKGLIAEEYNCLVGSGDTPPRINVIRDQDIPINVNTAFPEVIQSIDPSIDDTILQALIEDRDSNPYKTIAAFTDKIIDEMNFNPNDPADAKAQKDLEDKLKNFHFSSGSNYFEAIINVSVGRIQLTMISTLKRDGAKVTTIQRSIGVF